MKSLVVDDDSEVRALYSQALLKMSECESVASGEEACQSVRDAIDAQKPYTLILLDIMMPGIDGMETLHRIRKIEEERGVPASKKAKIIMVTGVSNRDAINRAFDEKCEAYLVKPFAIPRLYEVMGCLGLANPFYTPSTATLKNMLRRRRHKRLL